MREERSPMLEEVKRLAKTALQEQRVEGVLGLKKDVGNVIQPHIFERSDDLDALVLEPKWLFAKLAMKILRVSDTGYRLAVVCRGCDERAIVELVKRNQIAENSIMTIGIACGDAQAAACLCERPYPENIAAGEKKQGVDPFNDERVRQFLVGDTSERVARWLRVLRRCIKCYGCRNSCPICICEPCKLEDDTWVPKGVIPAEMMCFHLIRAFHLSDTCVACGACQDACPVGIPLLNLQLSMRRTLTEKFCYEAGIDRERKSPILRNFFDEEEKGRDIPDWVSSLE